MVDLAKRAFKTNNFLLAAEIYERSVIENGPNSELFMGLGDSYARSGNFTKAFESYSRAFRLGTPSVEKLKHLVSALIETVKQDPVVSEAIMNKKCIFTCVLCRGLLNDPVTILCGHTFCRKCFEKDSSTSCKKCGTVLFSFKQSNLKSNILISKVISNWFPTESRAAILKSRGNSYFEKKEFHKAIDLYEEAVQLAPNDHLILSNRSHAFNSLGKFHESLKDAEEVIRIRPDWPKGYYRKGCALFGLEMYEDSVVALLQCLALDSSVVSARACLSQALYKIFSPIRPNDPKSTELCSILSPSLLQKLVLANFNSTILLQGVTADKISKLQDIISDTMVAATSFAVNNQEMQPEFDKLEDLEMDSQDDSSKTVMPKSFSQLKEDDACRLRCSSVPDIPTARPISLHSRSRSQSPNPSASRKRGRIPSETTAISPTSPTKQLPLKLKKDEGAEDAFVVDAIEITPELLRVEDFECSICCRLLCEPVTTPCGHVFCRSCLDRCLDHQNLCPLCKSSLLEYLAERRQAVTESIETLIETYFPQEFEERKRIQEEETEELKKMVSEHQEIPVFVCTLALPGIPCPLHIFEPRYRLMVRQCMESGTRQFGMCVQLGDNDDDFSDYGCMLEIRDVQYFPDGRSLVDTVGGRRFRVLSRGHRNGYRTARVQFIADENVPEEHVEDVKKLQKKTYDLCKSWFDGLPGLQREQILRHLGPMPSMDEDFQAYPNGCPWLWWMLSVVPMDPRIQITMLSKTSYVERLEGIQRIVTFIQRKSHR